MLEFPEGWVSISHWGMFDVVDIDRRGMGERRKLIRNVIIPHSKPQYATPEWQS